MAELRNQFARAWQIAKINPAVCYIAKEACLPRSLPARSIARSSSSQSLTD
jgi:hypothetical protein